MQWDRQQIENAFIGEFAVHGEVLTGEGQRRNRRESIRIAILKNHRTREIFHDSQMTYAEAYRLLYGETIDRRGRDRTTPPPAHSPDQDDDNFFDDDDSQPTEDIDHG